MENIQNIEVMVKFIDGPLRFAYEDNQKIGEMIEFLATELVNRGFQLLKRGEVPEWFEWDSEEIDDDVDSTTFNQPINLYREKQF